jgi:Tol biopolymer transport system component
VDGRIWMIDADGTNARELLSHVPGIQHPIAWSADGSRLVYSGGQPNGIGLTDGAGSAPELHDLPCPRGADRDPVLSSCQLGMTVALSPNGRRVAYAIWEGTHDRRNTDVTSVLVTLDLGTERVTRLESTASTLPPACDAMEGNDWNHDPSWSADGSRLVYARGGAESNDRCQGAVLTVNVDDGELRQVVAPGQVQGRLHPRWSADDSSILVGATVGLGGDIYTVRPDGTGLRALTNDGLSDGPTWTRDGRIIFIRWTSPTVHRGAHWIIDADGANARPIETTIPALTAAGCLICAYPYDFLGSGAPIDPPEARQSQPLRMWETTTLLWQPMSGGQR